MNGIIIRQRAAFVCDVISSSWVNELIYWFPIIQLGLRMWIRTPLVMRRPMTMTMTMLPASMSVMSVQMLKQMLKQILKQMLPASMSLMIHLQILKPMKILAVSLYSMIVIPHQTIVMPFLYTTLMIFSPFFLLSFPKLMPSFSFPYFVFGNCHYCSLLRVFLCTCRTFDRISRYFSRGIPCNCLKSWQSQMIVQRSKMIPLFASLLSTRLVLSNISKIGLATWRT